MEKVLLNAVVKGDQKNAVIRAEGNIPAVCYGAGKESSTVVVTESDFLKAYRIAGENTVVELDIAGTKENVLVYDMQLHPITGKVQHVDFLFVDMNKPVIAPIPVEFVGKSAAVEMLGGVLNETLTEIEVEALPGDLPHVIEVDITALEDFNSVIHVSDVKVPANVSIYTDGELTIATVSAPRAAVEESELSPEEMEKAAMEAAVGKDESDEE